MLFYLQRSGWDHRVSEFRAVPVFYMLMETYDWSRKPSLELRKRHFF